MNQVQIQLHDHHQVLHLQPERMTFYLGSRIIEAINEKKEVYYIFFYKEIFLTVEKATQLRRRSFIEKAFKKGIVFDAPHPLFNLLFSAQTNHYKKVNHRQLITKLNKYYSSQEKAFILTFFDSFIPSKKIFDEISSLYYEYRRNGQMFLGYQILKILIDFRHNYSLVKQLASDIQFAKYADLYKQKTTDLLKKDVIFAEKMLYSQRSSDESFSRLIALLQKESRWIDILALYIDKTITTSSVDDYQSLVKLLEHYCKEDTIIHVLESLSSAIPSFIQIKKDLFKRYIENEKLIDALELMNEYEFEISESEVDSYHKVLVDYDLVSYSIRPKILSNLLRTVLHKYPEQAETLLTKYASLLLKTQEISFVKEWLHPFKTNHKDVKLFVRVDLMEKLSNDLDKMQLLGELYYEFNQLDKALECFSFEMELKPNDPKPLQWLSKIYRELEMPYESEAYRLQCINLQKRA